MTFDPPTADERRSLKFLTKTDEFAEDFNHLVLRFTDSTYEELKKSGGKEQGACDAGLLKDSQNAMRHRIHYNLDGRILEDVPAPRARRPIRRIRPRQSTMTTNCCTSLIPTARPKSPTSKWV